MASCARVLAVLLAIALVAPAAHADWSVYEGQAPQRTGGNPSTCVPGNQEQITEAGPILEVGAETSLLVNPMENCDCDVGVDFFWIEAVIWAEADGAATVHAVLRSQDPTDPNCPAPGDIECIGPDVLDEPTE